MSFDGRQFRGLLGALAWLAAPPAVVATEEGPTVVHLRTVKGEPVADGVVSFIPLDAPPPVVPPVPAEIRQRDETFSPHVTAVQVGAEVRLPNQDRVHHHVYSLSPAKRFELPLYAPGQAQSIVFDKPGVIVLGCNIHDWMAAYVVVVDTPWFAQSDANGHARLPTLPAGRYRLEVWHPQLRDAVVRDVSLPAAALDPIEISLTLKPVRRIRRAPTGPSREY